MYLLCFASVSLGHSVTDGTWYRFASGKIVSVSGKFKIFVYQISQAYEQRLCLYFGFFLLAINCMKIWRKQLNRHPWIANSPFRHTRWRKPGCRTWLRWRGRRGDPRREGKAERWSSQGARRRGSCATRCSGSRSSLKMENDNNYYFTGLIYKCFDYERKLVKVTFCY